jgi:hypothetical protein
MVFYHSLFLSYLFNRDAPQVNPRSGLNKNLITNHPETNRTPGDPAVQDLQNQKDPQAAPKRNPSIRHQKSIYESPAIT